MRLLHIGVAVFTCGGADRVQAPCPIEAVALPMGRRVRGIIRGMEVPSDGATGHGAVDFVDAGKGAPDGGRGGLGGELPDGAVVA